MRTRSDSILPSHFASTSSIHLEPTPTSTATSTATSSEEDVTHDLAPLLPQYERPPRKDLSPRTPRSRFVFVALPFLATVTILALVFRPPIFVKAPVVYDKGSIAITEQRLSDPAAINDGLLPFPPFYFSPLRPQSHLRPTLSTWSFSSSSCIDEYVANGRVCVEMANRREAQLEQPKLDLIYTWTNGSSSELMSSWKDEASAGMASRARARRERAKRAIRLPSAKVFKHFREHDELRYSIRSALASLSPASIGTVHLVVGDTPSHVAGLSETEIALLAELDPTSSQSSTSRSAQVPHWIDLSKIGFADLEQQRTTGPSLRLHPHSELFKVGAETEEDARNWQSSILPSFNSLAIESQLGNLATDATTAIYLNDDFFLNEPLSVSDFESPLTGPVFRMQSDLLVGGINPALDEADPESEWRSLGTAAFLLDRRFGRRKRPYLVHVAKSVSMPMLRELQTVFHKELTQTAEARFRGRGPVEAQTMHLLAHYTVEKHREALLWSYLVARSSSAQFYSTAERSKILSELGSTPNVPNLVPVFPPVRSTLSSLASRFDQTGLPPPRGTNFKFSSADGYAYSALDDATSSSSSWPTFGPAPRKRHEVEDKEEEGDDPSAAEADSGTPKRTRSVSAGEKRQADPPLPVCELDLELCFGRGLFDASDASPVSVEATLKRIAFEHPRCGDCLILRLVGASGEAGLEAFLPPPPPSTNASVTEQVTAPEVRTIGLGTTWQAVKLSSDPLANVTSRREFAISLIQRYSYAIGESTAAFRSIRHGGDSLTNMLEVLSFSNEYRRPPAFIALNDDVASLRPSVLEDVDRRLGRWFRSVWTEPSVFEKQ